MESMGLTSEKIIFCFPYKGAAGGVNMMFIRLASHLHTQGFDVSVLDYYDGRMAQDRDPAINLIPYFDNKRVKLPSGVTLIFQTMVPWSIYSSLSIPNDVKVFFITTLPANFYPSLPGALRDVMYEGGAIAKLFWKTLLRNEFNKSKQFLRLIESKESHALLDTNIVSNIEEKFNLKINNPKIMPLFSKEVTGNFYARTPSKKNVLCVGWVGRIADFKVHILNKVIFDLKKYSNENRVKINFIVVGKGDKECVLDVTCTNYFNMERVEYICAAELDKQLLKFDLYFAMGTSALDGARLGVPTVRLDYSYSKILCDYRYKFFFEVEGYSLGELIGAANYKLGEHTMSGIMHELLTNSVNISCLTYEFYKESFSISSTSVMLRSLIRKSHLTWGDLCISGVMTSKLYSMWSKVRG